jgi:iron-sulfur cluster repair protein YtfE (RIC family)
MPVQLGVQLGRREAAGDAVGLLLECHDRIRAFTALARRIAEAGAPDRETVVDAALRVRRYFTEALPLHAEDEERSILPRLRGLDPAVDAELAAMTDEHRAHERPLAALVAACEEIARVPARLAELQPVVARAAAELEAHFEEHLAREEKVIFPAIRRLLDPAVDAAIVGEIRARRRPGPAAPRSP